MADNLSGRAVILGSSCTIPATHESEEPPKHHRKEGRATDATRSASLSSLQAAVSLQRSRSKDDQRSLVVHGVSSTAIDDRNNHGGNLHCAEYSGQRIDAGCPRSPLQRIHTNSTPNTYRDAAAQRSTKRVCRREEEDVDVDDDDEVQAAAPRDESLKEKLWITIEQAKVAAEQKRQQEAKPCYYPTHNEIEEKKKNSLENIANLEERVNALEDNKSRQKFLVFIDAEKDLLTKWSVDVDLSTETAVAQKLRYEEVWTELFQVEKQARAAAREADKAKKKQKVEEKKKKERALKAAKREALAKEQARLEAKIEEWFPKTKYGKKTVVTFREMAKFLQREQIEVLRQIISLWWNEDDASRQTVDRLLLVLKKKHRHVEMKHSIRYLRFALHPDSPLDIMKTDEHLLTIRNRVYRITRQTETVVISGPATLGEPRSKEEFIQFMRTIFSEEETLQQAALLYP